MRATRVQCSLGSRSSFKLIPLLLAAALCVADDRFLFERARALEQAADLPGAEAAYRAYLQQSPASAEALGNLGVVLARQDLITVKELPSEVQLPVALQQTERTAQRANGPARTLDDMERDAILDALAQCHGNKKKAAELLGIQRPTLYNKMKRYAIEI